MNFMQLLENELNLTTTENGDYAYLTTQYANLDFFGINLGDIASEKKNDLTLLIIPVLTTVFIYLSVYVVSGKQNKKQQVMKDADGNEIPMPNMMVMNLMMDLVIMVMIV